MLRWSCSGRRLDGRTARLRAFVAEARSLADPASSRIVRGSSAMRSMPGEALKQHSMQLRPGPSTIQPVGGGIGTMALRVFAVNGATSMRLMPGSASAARQDPDQRFAGRPSGAEMDLDSHLADHVRHRRTHVIGHHDVHVVIS